MVASLSLEQFSAEVRAFLREQKPILKMDALTDDANLWDMGFIDSFSVVQLILLIETTLGVEVALKKGDVRNFYTIARMYEAYAPAAAGAAG